MASGAVYDAIEEFLTTHWTTSAIRWENKTFDPPTDGSGFVGVEMTGTLYGQMSMGEPEQADNRWDEEGVLWLHAFRPFDDGGSTARHWAKQLADLFRGQVLLSGSLEFRDAFIGRGHPGAEDGAWYRVTTFIKWRRIDA